MLALSIPLALLFAIAGLYALGHTLNLLTLGALKVAVGLLADDGIVVLEAILHRWETGRRGADGVWQGLKDIAAPDVSGALTTVSTYLPLIAVSRLAGLSFVPFALAMSLALLGSLVVSVTLIPLIASPPSTLHATRIHQCGQGPEAPQGAERALARLDHGPPGRQPAGSGRTAERRHRRPDPDTHELAAAAQRGRAPRQLHPAPGDLPRADTSHAGRCVRTHASGPGGRTTLVRIGSASGTAYTERSFAGEPQILLEPSAPRPPAWMP
jgi:cobalt-zinc-cadmium resistance protein CzcA